MRPPRISMINGLFHVTTRCVNKNFYFKEEEDFYQYLHIVEKARKKYAFKLHAYCITSNHVHLLLSTPKEDNLSKIMQYINGLYARNYNNRHKRTGHFWGGRFYSTIIQSETQLLNTIFYIELNMTRNHVTNHPKEWKWSSYHQHSEGGGPIKIDFHEIYLHLGNTMSKRRDIYKKIMTEKMIQKGLLSKQPHITDGLIFGTESFIQNVITKYTSNKYYKNKKSYRLDYKTASLKKPST